MDSLEWVTNESMEHPAMLDGMTRDEWLRWRGQFVRGRPKPPEGSPYSVRELEDMGLEGLYRSFITDPKEGS